MADNEKNFKFAMLAMVAIVAIVACFLLVKDKETYAAPDLQTAGQISALSESNQLGEAGSDSDSGCFSASKPCRLFGYCRTCANCHAAGGQWCTWIDTHIWCTESDNCNHFYLT
jgi:hypothetical protein